MSILHQCDNCRSFSAEHELNEIKRLSERVHPGSTMPSGECPGCGSVCYPVFLPDPEWLRRLEAADQNVRLGISELTILATEANAPIDVVLAAGLLDSMRKVFFGILVEGLNLVQFGTAATADEEEYGSDLGLEVFDEEGENDDEPWRPEEEGE